MKALGQRRAPASPTGPAKTLVWFGWVGMLVLVGGCQSPSNVSDSGSPKTSSRRRVTPVSPLTSSQTDRLGEVLARFEPVVRFAAGGGLEKSRAQVVKRSVLARAVLEQVKAEAKGMGLPTPDEVNEATANRWVLLDRPEAAQTAHAVVLVKKEEEEKPALALARKMARVVSNSESEEDFMAALQAVPRGALEVMVERLPPVTADGRTFTLDEQGRPAAPGPRFDPKFSRAAHQLGSVGEVSPPVRSDFGYHVIRLARSFPSRVLPFADRQREVMSDVYRRRQKDIYRELLARVRQQLSVEIMRDVAIATEQVSVSQ